ncbi:SpaA isopeptide-forming pilin-related protein [Acidipropionibacterium jensenii]|uniref:SpaA isopeptide-forming pilin-related protein n=1 Tax=Acidipropionibacterium jensenii TaxID=1749 RepID=UPI00214B039A
MSYSFRTGNLNQNSTTDVPGPTANWTYEDIRTKVRNKVSNYFSGLMAASLNNPEASTKCGQNIALVLDQSGSMIGTKQTNLKSAAHATIDALTGTPSTLAIYTFSQKTGNAQSSTSTLTSTSAGSLHSFVDGLDAPSGATNWDAGLYQVAQSTTKYDMVIFLTDGAPTVYRSDGAGAGSYAYFQYVEHGIFSANAIKHKGTRLVGVGIGLNTTAGGAANLSAVTGPTPNSDYYQQSDDNFGTTLKQLASGACASQLNITKQLQDANGNLITPTPADANGITFTHYISTGSTVGATATTQTVNGVNGQASAAISIPVSATPTITVTEPEVPGYTFVWAQCSVNGTNVTTTLNGSSASFKSASQATHACTFTNKQKPGAATWKKVSSDGTPLLGGSTWTLMGPNVPANTVVTDCTSGSGTTCPAGAYTDQDPVAGQFSLTGLAWGSYTLTEKSAPTGYVLDATPHSFTISGASLSTTVTGSPFKNSPQSAFLTLVKKVTNTHGGTATPTDWTLTATVADKTISGKTGDAAITTATVPPGTYTLTESNGPAGYDPSSWSCTGATVSNNSVTLAQGNSATCTITNSDRPGSVTWTKKDSSGSLLNGSEWTLTPPGAPAVTITDCTTSTCPTGDLKDQDPAPGKFKLSNLSWGSYTLTEAKAPMGYVLDTTSHTFTVGPDVTKNQVGVPGPTSIGDFTNTQAKVPVLPLTGGMSTDAFLIAGGAALAAAGLAGWWSRRRSHRAGAR